MAVFLLMWRLKHSHVRTPIFGLDFYGTELLGNGTKGLKVLVLTDGEPNCDVERETITDYPAKWLSQDINTYVFGLPGSSSATDVLDRIAEAGGTGQHFSSDPGDTPEDLGDRILTII